MAEKIEEKSTNKNRRGDYQSPESKENVKTTKKRTTKKTDDALTAGKTNNQTATKKRTTKKTDDALTAGKTNNQTATKKRTTKEVEDTSKENAKTTTKKRTTKKVEDVSKENAKTTAKKRTTKKTEDESTVNKKRRGDNQSTESKEKIKNKSERLPVVEKKEKNTLTKKEQKELETIEKEIKSKQVKSQEKMSTIYTNVFKNILYAIIVILYFILIIMGYKSIKSDVFITDLKVFSMTLIITTICVFEKAYKKDSGKLAVTGIEFLVLSICTLLSIRIYTIFNSKFVSSMTSFALLFAIYYVAKAIKVYIQEKKQLKKEVNDIVTRRE